jgi:hypothetical protein
MIIVHLRIGRIRMRPRVRQHQSILCFYIIFGGEVFFVNSRIREVLELSRFVVSCGEK